jgi:hypothetical protein
MIIPKFGPGKDLFRAKKNNAKQIRERAIEPLRKMKRDEVTEKKRKIRAGREIGNIQFYYDRKRIN